ncbi:hypothetical protein CISIN_1g0389492mg, partial [Citrus sinensis]
VLRMLEGDILMNSKDDT